MAWPADGFDALDAEYENGGPREHHRRRNHKGPVVFPGAMHDPTGEPRRGHAGEVGEAVLEAGPLSRRARAGERLRDGEDVRGIEAEGEACESSSAVATFGSLTNATGKIIVESVRPMPAKVLRTRLGDEPRAIKWSDSQPEMRRGERNGEVSGGSHGSHPRRAEVALAL